MSASKLVVEWVDRSLLKPYKNNAKRHPETQLILLSDQIRAHGWDQPIVVDSSYVIIKGHGRWLASERLSSPLVPVLIRDDLSPQQVRAARLADNKLAQTEMDPTLLQIELLDLKNLDFQMDLSGYGELDIDSILNPADADNAFTDRDRRSVSERQDEYETSSYRQIILVMEPETFDPLMRQFAQVQEDLGVETTLQVVQELFKFYAENRSSKARPDGSLSQEP